MTESEKVQQIPFRDSSLEGMKCDYDTFEISFILQEQVELTLVVFGYISFSMLGHWDENIVEEVEVLDDADQIGKVLEAIVERHGGEPTEPGGGTRDFKGPWSLVRVSLIDGAKLEVIGQAVALKEGSFEGGAAQS